MWKPYSVALLGLLLSSCSTPLPAWHGRIYQGDHQAQAVVRHQAGEVIKASDPAFDGFMAMRWEDFNSFAETFVFSCKEWNQDAPFSAAQLKAFLESLKGIK